VTNGSGEDEALAVDPNSRMIDDSGNEYYRELVRLGANEAFGSLSVVNTLVSGIPTSLVITFRGVSPDTRRVALLEIKGRLGGVGFFGGGRPFAAQIRNIPLAK
jgi:hypothetical protein